MSRKEFQALVDDHKQVLAHPTTSPYLDRQGLWFRQSQQCQGLSPGNSAMLYQERQALVQGRNQAQSIHSRQSWPEFKRHLRGFPAMLETESLNAQSTFQKVLCNLPQLPPGASYEFLVEDVSATSESNRKANLLRITKLENETLHMTMSRTNMPRQVKAGIKKATPTPTPKPQKPKGQKK